MKRALALSAFVLTFALVLPSPTSAQTCTATQSCNDACSLDYFCPSPYPPCELMCFAPSRSVSCSGASSCSVGSNSVTCDGVTTTCPSTSQCIQGWNYVQCRSTIRRCTNNCPL